MKVSLKKLAAGLAALLSLQIFLSSCDAAKESGDTTTTNDQSAAPGYITGVADSYYTTMEPENFSGERFSLPDYTHDRWTYLPMTEQLLANNTDWIIFGSLRYYQNCAGIQKSRPEFELIRNYCAGSEEYYCFDFDIMTELQPKDEIWQNASGFYCGLRLPGMASIPVTADAVWLKIYAGKIGVQGSADNEFVCFDLPYSTGGMFRRIFIEDIQEENTINIYVSDNSNTRVLALILHLQTDESQNTVIHVFTWKDQFKSSVKIEKRRPLYGGGYAKLYNNASSEVYMKDVAFFAQ